MVVRSSSLAIEDFGTAVWRADALAGAVGATLASGHAALDLELPGGGWPVGSMSEILQDQLVSCEWRLLLPALTRVGAPVVLVGAPHVPFGPGLRAQGLAPQCLLWINAAAPAARLWATEQALRCADVSAVLAWLPQVRAEALRRLQHTAQAHSKLLFVMRPQAAQRESSPAVLRLLVSNQPAAAQSGGATLAASPVDALQVQILKRRGPPLAHTLSLFARPARLAVFLALNAGLTQGADDALDRLAAIA